MNKSFTVDKTCNNMRLDRWLRIKLGKIPQGLIEKNLRLGKIKINKKKVKSSFKIKTNDEINIFNIEFKESIQQKKGSYYKILVGELEESILENDKLISKDSLKKTHVGYIDNDKHEFRNITNL